jgi:hypothetical protein
MTVQFVRVKMEQIQSKNSDAIKSLKVDSTGKNIWVVIMSLAILKPI